MVEFFCVSFVTEWEEITSCLKLVRIMIEIWNLVGIYTSIFSFRKNYDVIYMLVPLCKIYSKQ